MLLRTVVIAVALAACGAPQAKECEKFLACSEAIMPMSTMRSSQTYGPGGTCWGNTTTAAQCRDICNKALEALKAGSGASTPECQ